MDGGLVGRSYGPVRAVADPSSVSSFVAAVGDDPVRWADVVPPLFANALLFRAAPLFLDDPGVAPYTVSLIHSEQAYEWSGPLDVGATLDVSGEVDQVRARSGLNLVTFSITAGEWLRGRSVFVMSDEAAGSSEEEPEPPALERPQRDAPHASPLPSEGEEVPAMRCGASRADLVRYAAATGDFNPIHWDHAAAAGAGLPGTVVHGLLMAGWLGAAAARHAEGPAPLRSMRVRFRKALRPGAAATVTGRVASVEADGADLDLVLASGEDRLVTATVRVTR
jgi:acyl dehydratase